MKIYVNIYIDIRNNFKMIALKIWEGMQRNNPIGRSFLGVTSYKNFSTLNVYLYWVYEIVPSVIFAFFIPDISVR